jgi:hypothetical protein
MVWSESAYPAPPTRNRRAGRQAGRHKDRPPTQAGKGLPPGPSGTPPKSNQLTLDRDRHSSTSPPCRRRARLHAAYPTPQHRRQARDQGQPAPDAAFLVFPKSARLTLHPLAPRQARAAPALFSGNPPPQRIPVFAGTCTGEIEAKDGLPSADRNNKATLLLTGPFRTAKSSAKDLTPLVLKLQYAKYHNHSSVAVEESPAKTLSRSLFLSICTCGWYHRVLAWILT